MAERCRSFYRPGGFIELIGKTKGKTIITQCRLPLDHESNHENYVQPFPGFADEHVVWENKREVVNDSTSENENNAS